VATVYTPPSSTTWAGWISQPSWSTSTTCSQNYVWSDWNITSSSTSTTLNVQGHVWQDWLSRDPVEYQWRQPTPETAAERQARADRLQAERERLARESLAAQKRMEGAQERGMELLLSILTAEERAWHDQHGEFMVRTESGRIYVIEKRGVHGNIRETDEHGCLLGRICVAPGMMDHEAGLSLPLADGWLGQYLAIKHNEEALRTIGNWSSRGPCRQPDVPILRAA
jgi:hypothetical protein